MSTAAPAPRSAIRALSVLTAINLLNYLDRYVVSPLVPELKEAMALSDTELGWLVFFRCTTFVGVCVEFVAAVTWLSELFPDKRQREGRSPLQ